MDVFRATTFCFLTIVFSVVVALLGAFSFNAILRSHFHLLLLNRNVVVAVVEEHNSKVVVVEENY